MMHQLMLYAICGISTRMAKNIFEIKSSINEFEMSINEYNSMKNFPNDYEVVLVDIKNNTISRHTFKELEPLKQISKYFFVFKQIEK